MMKKIILLLVLLLVLTGCSINKKETVIENQLETVEPLDESKKEEQLPEEPVWEPGPLEIKNRNTDIEQLYVLNKDTIGWLYIPGLDAINSGVFQDTKSYSYAHKNANGEVIDDYEVNGVYYTHIRNTFGNSADDLSTNTIIFGCSDLGKTNLNCSDDDPDGPLFSQLFNFRDLEFAKKTPYIFFSTTNCDLVWEVFSVFYNDAEIDGGKNLWYIEPEPGDEYQFLLDTMKSRSIYDYDVEVTTDDKILTLSTATVGYGLKNRQKYRFVIAAKLVENTEGLMEKRAELSINQNAPSPMNLIKLENKGKMIAKARKDNNDIESWINIPGLENIDTGIQYSDDKNIYKQKINSDEALFYTTSKDLLYKTFDELPENIAVFGYNGSVDSTQYGDIDDSPVFHDFSQLFKYRDPEFAKNNPYIFFFNLIDGYVYEIFSIMYYDSEKDIDYTIIDDKTYQSILDMFKKNSLYNYDINVTSDDKIIILSTNTIGYGKENSDKYNFVVAAKLVSEDKCFNKYAEFTINEEAPIPPTFEKRFLNYVEDKNSYE